ncbi:MAG: HlyD family efflux transporter periplasmic adaptor subunit [bacterium]
MKRLYRDILTKVFIGIVVYICFVQPNLWKYTLKTLSPTYSAIERTVKARGIILYREETINSPVSGIVLKLKKDSTRVSKGEIVAAIFPTAEDYNIYMKEVNSIISYYDNMIKEKNDLIKSKKDEIEKIYLELTKKSNILNSLLENKHNITEVLGDISKLNARIDLLKKEIEKSKLEMENLKREKDQRIDDLKQKIISYNTAIATQNSGIISFSIDNRENIRNSLLEKGINSTNLQLDSLIEEPRIISDGDPIKKGEIIAKVIDNLEQFVLLDVTLDGKSPIVHNEFSINIDGKEINIELLKWVSKYPKELWLCKIKSPYYIGPRCLNLDIKIGTIEGLVIPRSLIKSEGERYFVYVLGNNSIEKRFIEVLGGNQIEAVVSNLNRDEVLLAD